MNRKIGIMSAVAILSMAGCGGMHFNNDLPMVRNEVSYLFNDAATNKYSVVVGSGVNFGGISFYNKHDQSSVIKSVLAGDVVETYYTNSDYKKIDHVLVDPVILVKVTHSLTPGSGQIRFFIEGTNDVFVHSDSIIYLMNSRDTFESISNVYKYEELYATYKPDERVVNKETGFVSVTINAVYSYYPR